MMINWIKRPVFPILYVASGLLFGIVLLSTLSFTDNEDVISPLDN